MSIRQPKFERPAECRVISQALCFGEIETQVRAVSGQAARSGAAHIAIRFGSLLVYLENREALSALTKAVTTATELADRVFGPEVDAFTQAEAADVRRFESGQMSAAALRRRYR